MATQSHDLIVLGGGISGISAARTYLDVHPTADVIVVERDGTVGGTWNKERLYPGFKAQASSRMCEFSDMPISVPTDGEDENGCPYAEHIAEYLEIYVDKHVYDGKSLRDRFLLNSNITAVEKADDGQWHVHFTQTGEKRELTSEKLLVSTGVSSLPNIPNFNGTEDFSGPIIHSINFGHSWESIKTSESIQNVTVLGAGKSSADFVYQLVKAGILVAMSRLC
jgi:dimethylaniline monooxygenase (N-oxide forming)